MNTPPPLRTANILEEAASIVADTRGDDYGHPKDNHTCTAVLWSAFLSRRLRAPVTLTARDVCLLNILQKTSREANREKRDNLVDIAGYALNAEMCGEEVEA